MSIRQRLEQAEQSLSSRAAQAVATRGRQHPEAECPLRTAFQRDRDRILHSSAFRRLKHKTQVFLSPEGDHYRTRLTHTLEVAQIARTIARALQLNEDLTEAIALGHDLGHTPFGHAGERALREVYPAGFNHYVQSLRVVDKLEDRGQGLNLTWEVRNGIERHTTGPQPNTLEGQCVRLADRIAYINHDIDDARRAGVLDDRDIPPSILGSGKRERIHNLVLSAVENSGDIIALDPATQAAFDTLHKFMFDHVYFNPLCKSEESKVIDIIAWLYEHFTRHAEELPEDFQRIGEEDGVQRAAVDYIAGMTDRFAVHVFEACFVPRAWTMR